jgi:hypothetical protein
MSVAPGVRGTLRISAMVAGAHFLLFHMFFGLLLMAPRGAAARSVVNFLSAGLLPLIAPAALLPIHGDRRLAFFAPPASMLPVAFASIVWAVAICGVWLLVHRFVRYRFSTHVRQLGRRFALVFALIAITWLFFGPVFGFAGDLMFGVLDPARIMDGRFLVRPPWLVISVSAWAACVYGAYRFLIIAPSTHEPPPT